MREKILFSAISIMALLASAMILFLPVAEAIPASTNVAIVPDPDHTNDGTLPSMDPAFAGFTFTNLAWADVNAANLAGYDTVVLVIEDTTVPLTDPQKTDLIDWVFNGGKLIIYDSEVEPSVDYSWLPYPMTTENPGAAGYTEGAITYVEENSLGSTDPLSPFYIDITMVPTGGWSDAIGDCNVFVTYDPNWCGDIEAQNWYSYPDSPGYDGSPAGWVHTYAPYGGGLFIYNGFDMDPMVAGSTPDPTIPWDGNPAKIWLLELQQPWGDDYNLPCERKAVERLVGGEALQVREEAVMTTLIFETFATYWWIPAFIVAIITASIVFRKRRT